MSRKTKIAPQPTAEPDWREAAEARGRAAFEQAVAELQPTPEPPSWLGEQTRKHHDKESEEDEAGTGHPSWIPRLLRSIPAMCPASDLI
jgi:hypothetical protein